jgi:hypothetical protein
MPETESHIRAKKKAAGKKGHTEKPLKGGGRLDAATRDRAVEVERSGDKGALRKAASRLKKSGKKQRVLQVPQKDMDEASEAMREQGVSGTVKNMSGTKRRSIPKAR